MGGDLSPKKPVQALRTFFGRPDAFPDKSGPTKAYPTGRRGLVPEEAGASAAELPWQIRRLPGQVRSTVDPVRLRLTAPRQSRNLRIT